MNKIRYLEVILKTVERCNINCTYCYFFNGIDQSFLKHPIYISQDTLKKVAIYLKNICKKHDVKVLQIDFHGGEPLMQKKDQFDEMCMHFRNELGDLVSLCFAVQTNAMLINDAWINLFNKHNVKVGISIDGPKDYNDKYRVDHKGRGTYEKVVAGINKLKAAVNEGNVEDIGALCVINPEFPGKKIYRHLVDHLSFKKLDFLLPDFTHDNFKTHLDKTGLTVKDYGQYLNEIFYEWTNDNDPEIYVRILGSTILSLLGRETSLMNFGPTPKDVFAFTIASNGDVLPDDTLRSSNLSLYYSGLNVVKSNSVTELQDQKIFKLIEKSNTNLPSKCKECCWEKVCLGGMHINRYSSINNFDNPSVFCEGLKDFYTNVSIYLLESGLSYDSLKKTLGIYKE